MSGKKTVYEGANSSGSQYKVYIDGGYAYKNRDACNFRTQVSKELIGCSLITRYNNKTYRLDDIAWDANPMSSFNMTDGSEMTYYDYYQKHYGKDISKMFSITTQY